MLYQICATLLLMQSDFAKHALEAEEGGEKICLVLKKVLMFPCVNWSRVFICLNKSSKF